MSEATIGGLVILAVLGLVIAWALVRGGARCDGYTDDPDNWRADGARDDPSVVVATRCASWGACWCCRWTRSATGSTRCRWTGIGDDPAPQPR